MTSNTPYPLTSEQFDRLIALIDAGALAAASRMFQEDIRLRDARLRTYEGHKNAARDVLVGKK